MRRCTNRPAGPRISRAPTRPSSCSCMTASAWCWAARRCGRRACIRCWPASSSRARAWRTRSRREVAEEVGITLGEVTYHSSQPWPFPSSIMLGFMARATTTELNIATDEIETARWYTRAELRASPENEVFRLPRRDSIARRLVEDWLAGHLTPPARKSGTTLCVERLYSVYQCSAFTRNHHRLPSNDLPKSADATLSEIDKMTQRRCLRQAQFASYIHFLFLTKIGNTSYAEA